LCFEEEGWSAALVGVLDDPASRRRFLRNTSTNDLEAFAAHKGALVIDAWDVAMTERSQNADAPSASSQTSRAKTNSSQADGIQTASSQTGGTRAIGPQASGSQAIDPTFDDLPAGTILFDTAGIFTSADYAALWERVLEHGCSTLSTAEARLIRESARRLKTIDDSSWCARAFPDGYGYLAAVCVNPHYRGLGVLGALLDPIIARAEGLRIPLCLETYAERSMNIYAHKGFELIDVTTNEELGLTQYCMARIPE
jgi:GNAT superfamily N-acetyltransferase